MASIPLSVRDKSVVYRIETDDLDQLIESQLKLLNFSKSDKKKKIEALQDQLNIEEEKQHEIDLIFTDCLRMIENFKAEIEAEQAADKYDEPQVILSGSDSDDDVQFIEATYEPLLVNNKSAKQTPERVQPTTPLPPSPQLLPQPVPCRVVPHSPVLVCQSPVLTSHTPVHGGHTPVVTGQSPMLGGHTPMLTSQSLLVTCQSPLVAGQSPLLTSQSPLVTGQSPLLTSQSPLVTGQSPLISPRYTRLQQILSPPDVDPQSPSFAVLSKLLKEPPVVTGMGISNKQFQQTSPELLQPRGVTFTEHPPKHIDLAVGMKLYGRKFNDIWYKGALVDIQNKDAPRKEHNYKVKFDRKGMKVLSGMHVACIDVSTDVLPVGTRVIALYKAEESPSNWFYAGIIAEPANIRNNNRYLVFFDDGYAQYSFMKHVHQVVEQSRNVWEDIHPDSSQFIQDYLNQYPERPMVRLQEKQMVKTEWKGKWWAARVQKVDASLVQMYFDSDKRVEWIYRGSTRLEPLYTELANAEASKVSGKGRRHNIHIKSRQKPFVEYTRGNEDEAGKPEPDPKKSDKADGASGHEAGDSGRKKRSVARKSTSKPAQVVIHDTVDITDDAEETAPVKEEEIAPIQASPAVNSTVCLSDYQPRTITLKRDMATILQERLSGDSDNLGEDILGETMEIEKLLPIRDTDKKKFKQHTCCASCIKDVPDDQNLKALFKFHNPLLIPQLCGWERQITKQSNFGKRVIVYRTPCARRLRAIEEVDKYLVLTNSHMTIDMFCFDSQLHTDTEYVPVRTFCDIKDLSYGKETVPISCVNGIDREYPDYVEYSNQRTPAKGVKLNLDPAFLVGCDCTDGCRDRTKCRCAQLTEEATQCIAGNEDSGYHYRRLPESLITGVYECNVNCKCDSRCRNRVVQNGLQLRLQVFKTEKRGWGLHSLDDIPAGGFICVYVGQLLTEQGANEDGQQFGDEYLAELDYIEVVERVKDGYESNVDEGEGSSDDVSDNAHPAHNSDSTYSGEKRIANKKAKKKNGVSKIVLKREDNKAWSVKFGEQELTGANKTQDWLNSINMDAIVISDDDEVVAPPAGEVVAPSGGEVVAPPAAEGNDDELPDLDEHPLPPVIGKHREQGSSHDDAKEKTSDGMESWKITDPTSLNIDDVVSEDSDDNMFNEQKASAPEFKRTTRSQTHSRFSNLPDPKSQKVISPQQNPAVDDSPVGVSKKEDFVDRVLCPSPDKKQTVSTRPYFGEQFSYVMDAKSMGNLGRYLNHSCSPNVFVQNVFVDTHDLRFPWIAFFAAQYIRAGTELTWDYNYEVGSVPGKVLYCYCGSAECRGRLL